MADKLKIKISVADRVYPLTIDPSREEGLRKAAKSIEVMMKQLEQSYAVRDKQDLLAMCALQFAAKAEQIIPKDFINEEKRVFGSIFEITGNAASHIQFHVTDSTSNFIKGSLYFYAKPNYDSVLPAIDYIKEDILYLIETLEWAKKPL